MATYDKPGIYTPDFTAIGEGLKGFGAGLAAGKAAKAKKEAAAQAAAAKEKLERDKLAMRQKELDARSKSQKEKAELAERLRKQKNKLSNANKLNKLDHYSSQDFSQRHKDFLENQLNLLDEMEEGSDEYVKQLGVIDNLANSLNVGIELVNTEAKDWEDLYRLENGQYVLNDPSVAGNMLMTNYNLDEQDLIVDYATTAGANIKFEGGTYKDSQGNWVFSDNVGLTYNDPDDSQRDPVFLDFKNLPTNKSKGNDIFEKTNGESFKQNKNTYWTLFKGDYEGMAEEYETVLATNKKGTFEKITTTSYDKANDAFRDKMLAQVNPDPSSGMPTGDQINVNQSDWQLMGGYRIANGNKFQYDPTSKEFVAAGTTGAVDVPVQINPNDPQHREMFAVMMANTIENEKSKVNKQTIEEIREKERKTPQHQQRLQQYRTEGIGGSWGNVNVNQLTDGNAKTEYIKIQQAGKATPEQIKKLAKGMPRTNAKDLTLILNGLNGTKKYKSGAEVQDEIKNQYEQDFINLVGRQPQGIMEILDFAEGNMTQKPATIYPNATDIGYGDLLDDSGAYAVKQIWKDEAAIEKLLYNNLDIDNKTLKADLISGIEYESATPTSSISTGRQKTKKGLP